MAAEVKTVFNDWDEPKSKMIGEEDLETLLLKVSPRLNHADVQELVQGAANCGVVSYEDFIDYVWGKPAPARTSCLPDEFFVINGFYMSMRDCYTKPGASVYYFLVEWDCEKLPWASFRGEVVGATDPAEAAPGSLRAQILDQWSSLGLAEPPNVGNNGIHASASPLEATAEVCNWLGRELSTDPFSSALLASGVRQDVLSEWLTNPLVEFEGKRKDLFDHLEDLDANSCIERALTIAGVDPGAAGTASSKNRALVFVKPHARTEYGRVEELVRKRLCDVGISVTGEGRIDHKTIDEKRLVDIHYGAIATKASLQKPAELRPSEKALKHFADKFEMPWEEALAKQLLFNAFDICKLSNSDGEKLNNAWEIAMSRKHIQKLGGGFKCARIQLEDIC